MSENGTQTSDDGSEGRTDKEQSKHNARLPFQAVRNKYGNARALSERAPCIRRTDIVAAIVAQILMPDQFSKDQPTRNRSNEIGGDGCGEIHHCSSSLRARTTRRIGVPSKPKLSRRRFSIKRR